MRRSGIGSGRLTVSTCVCKAIGTLSEIERSSVVSDIPVRDEPESTLGRDREGPDIVSMDGPKSYWRTEVSPSAFPGDGRVSLQDRSRQSAGDVGGAECGWLRSVGEVREGESI